jgi:hypothetical protein
MVKTESLEVVGADRYKSGVMEYKKMGYWQPDYEPEELLAIAKLMLAEQNYRFSTETESVFRDYLALRMTMPHFANAHSVRNALDRARLRQANRLFASNRTLTKLDLMTIEPEDILASRVFSEGSLDTDTDGKLTAGSSRTN